MRLYALKSEVPIGQLNPSPVWKVSKTAAFQEQ